MSVSIMEMPESCLECPAQFDGKCVVMPPDKAAETLSKGRPEWCPLVAVGTCAPNVFWLEEVDETADSGETAVWEALGHRIGFMKHPLSEDYRCPLCGYEAYTVFAPPPSVCPRCHARMSMPEDESK